MFSKGIVARRAIGVFAGVLLAGSPAVQALNYHAGDVQISLDSDFTIGAGVRMQSPDLDLIGRANTPEDALKASCEATPGGTGCGQAYSTNGDDGNLKFDKHDIVSALSKITSDLTLKWGDFGIFARGNYLFDVTNNELSFFDDADFGGIQHIATKADREAKIDALQDHIGNDFKLLDAYLFGNFEVFDRLVNFRVGDQVLNWGESTFVLNGINSLLALDANQARLPGAAVEEIFRPQGMAFLAADITDSIGIELFYQYDWEETIIDASGSFYSTNDFAGIGGTHAEIGFGRCGENTTEVTAGGDCGTFAPTGSAFPRSADREPDDGGQFGAALRFYIPALNDMDLGVYYANYHSRLPLFSGSAAQPFAAGPLTGFPDTSTARYFVEYPEDIKMYGVSFNTLLGDVAFQGEYSYKQDQPLQVEDVELFLAGLGSPASQVAADANGYVKGFRRLDVSQIDLSFTKILGPSPMLGSAQTLMLFEVAAMKVHGMDAAMSDNGSEQLRFEAPGTYTPGNAAVAGGSGVPTQDADGYADDLSWGYKVGMRLEYNNVFDVLTVRPSLLWQHDVNGTSPTPVLNFIDDRQQVRVGVEADYLGSISFGVTYNRTMEGGLGNLLTDRDNLQVAYKISF